MSFIYQEIAGQNEIRRRINPTLIEEIIDYLWYLFRIFLITAIFFSFIKTKVFDVVTVSGRSMYPTYDSGNQVYVDFLTPNFGEYRRGDVVIVKMPPDETGNPIYYIKRIIGLPGDTIIIEDGQIILVNKQFENGVILDESNYLPSTTKTYKLINTDSERTVEPTLQQDQYYVLGDNRTGSKDSRIIGAVERRNILGREFFRISPSDKWGTFKVPSYKDVPN